jgi:hypothetical protein
MALFVTHITCMQIRRTLGLSSLDDYERLVGGKVPDSIASRFGATSEHSANGPPERTRTFEGYFDR